jgi:hypothetical protein
MTIFNLKKIIFTLKNFRTILRIKILTTETRDYHPEFVTAILTDTVEEWAAQPSLKKLPLKINHHSYYTNELLPFLKAKHIPLLVETQYIFLFNQHTILKEAAYRNNSKLLMALMKEPDFLEKLVSRWVPPVFLKNFKTYQPDHEVFLKEYSRFCFHKPIKIGLLNFACQRNRYNYLCWMYVEGMFNGLDTQDTKKYLTYTVDKGTPNKTQILLKKILTNTLSAHDALSLTHHVCQKDFHIIE